MMVDKVGREEFDDTAISAHFERSKLTSVDLAKVTPDIMWSIGGHFEHPAFRRD